MELSRLVERGHAEYKQNVEEAVDRYRGHCHLCISRATLSLSLSLSLDAFSCSQSQGTALLVSTQTEVDRTGQSYYGETNLYYLSTSANTYSVQFGVYISVYKCTCICIAVFERFYINWYLFIPKCI